MMTGSSGSPFLFVERNCLAKLIVTREGVVEQTIQLSKERMTFGRHRHNDIVLNHPAVSGEHGVITTILDDSFLEDLHSTNGTFVNGHRIGKHFLQNKDVIKMAKFHLEFVQDGIRPLVAAAAAAPTAPPLPTPTPGVPGPARLDNFATAASIATRTAPLPAPSAAAPAPATAAPADAPIGRIELLNGPNAGKSMSLTKPATSLGRPGVQVVIISRTADGYTAAHIEGTQSPMLNNVAMSRAPQRLSDGDVLDLGGTRMSFRTA
jgi:pSer/pThr/pTyr-binding forkhead associated (FHA) protein